MEPREMAERLLVSFSGEMHSVRAGTFMAALGADVHILTTVNRVMSKGKGKLEVRVSAPTRGSFEFVIEVVGLGISVPTMFGYEPSAYLRHLIDVYSGIHKIKKFLKGDEPVATHVEGDQIILENVDGDVLYVKNSTINIYNAEPLIDRSLTDKFAMIETENQIDGLRISGPEEEVVIDRSDFPVLARPSKGIEETERVKPVRSTLSPVSWFSEGESAWYAYYNGEKIRVYMHEAEMNGAPFYDTIKAGSLRFAPGDVMEVQMQIRQVFDPNYKTFVNKSYEVTQVYNYIMRGDQNDLFGQGPGDE